MIIEQIYTSCLSQAAYFIESNGEIAIIDPLREVDAYIKKANELNAKIKYIFETHFHADFVSGHLELAQKTGAKIIYGTGAKPNFDAHIAQDNELFSLGTLQIKTLHTPGHTLESSCFLLFDENGKEHCIFTGDTLFIGDVGRPDLAQKTTENITEIHLAEMLFDSLRTKIIPLPNDLIIYPSHGAGSSCGKNLSKETFDTLGHQKEVNYALRANMTKAEFVEEVLDGLSAPPAYFPMNVALNINGYKNLDEIIEHIPILNAHDFKSKIAETNALILDVRTEQEFVAQHIKGSVFVGLNGQFAPWVGAVIKDVNTPLLLVTPVGKETETITRLARVGFDNVIGVLQNGFESWLHEGLETDFIQSITVEDFEKNYTNHPIIDARKTSEFANGHVENAKHLALDTIEDHLDELPKEPFYVYCGGGYRSVIFSSILKRKNIHHVTDVQKGYAGIKNSKVILK